MLSGFPWPERRDGRASLFLSGLARRNERVAKGMGQKGRRPQTEGKSGRREIKARQGPILDSSSSSSSRARFSYMKYL